MSREEMERDAARYQWLRENAGRWSCAADPGVWTRDGVQYWPRVSFAANGTAYNGQDLDAAVDAASKHTR